MDSITEGTIKEMRKVKEVCLKLMSIDERCRNDDLWLMIQGYREMGFNIYIDYKDLDKMPRPETWKRVRAQIQNRDKMYQPTSEKVIKRRKSRRKAIQRYME